MSWQHACGKQWWDFPLDEYHLFVGKPSRAIAQVLAERIGKDCAEQILCDKRAHYHHLQNGGHPPIQATINFLRLLAKEKEKRNLKLGLTSAARKEEILLNLRHQGIDHLFDVILSGQDDLGDYHDPDGVNKPKPYIYLQAMKLLGVFPAECIVIEDSASGVKAATTAGCFTIAVPNDFTRYHDLSLAHLQMDSFADIDIDKFFKIVDQASNKLSLKITDYIQSKAVQGLSSQRRFIVTGGPGAGKTSIINHLADRGYLTIPEAASDVIAEGLLQSIHDPWMADDYHIKICSHMRARQQMVKNSSEKIIFFDRGHLDGLTYILLQRRNLPQEVLDYVQATMTECFYEKTVFFVESLNFCSQAPNRTETLNEALMKSHHLKQNYLALGYDVISIPPGTVAKRAELILEHM